VSASIDGSFSVGVSLDAAFPLDLFGQCGLIARLRAEAEAAAYFRANVDINSEGEAGAERTCGMLFSQRPELE